MMAGRTNHGKGRMLGALDAAFHRLTGGAGCKSGGLDAAGSGMSVCVPGDCPALFACRLVDTVELIDVCGLMHAQQLFSRRRDGRSRFEPIELMEAVEYGLEALGSFRMAGHGIVQRAVRMRDQQQFSHVFGTNRPRSLKSVASGWLAVAAGRRRARAVASRKL